jgi:DNA adenine methylase
MSPKPFVKWAGGKTRMIPFILSSFPDKMNTYFEPFLGGGSVFFEMLRQKRFKKAVIGDSNVDLMAAFSVVQSDVDSLVKELKDRRYKYDRRVYLRIRAEDPAGFDQLRRAARFLYLNRTCFNGLYRVNRDGEFNTPFGKYDNPLICDEENLRAVSAALKHVKLVCADFSTIVEKAKKGDGVYFDPPYLPISKTASFTAYSAGGFGLGDHYKLAGYFRELVGMGVNVVLSNSLSEKTRGMYSDFDVKELTGARSIGGPAEYRVPVKEMMVVGGPAKTGEKVA